MESNRRVKSKRVDAQQSDAHSDAGQTLLLGLGFDQRRWTEKRKGAHSGGAGGVSCARKREIALHSIGIRTNLKCREGVPITEICVNMNAFYCIDSFRLSLLVGSIGLSLPVQFDIFISVCLVLAEASFAYSFRSLTNCMLKVNCHASSDDSLIY